MSYEWRAEKANDYDYPPIGGHPQEEPYGETLARLRDQLQYANEIILEQRDEIRELREELAQKNESIAACEHGLPRDCCKICVGAQRIAEIARHEARLDARESSFDAEMS